MKKSISREKAEQMLEYVKSIIDIDSIPLDDEATYKLLQQADTDGIFLLYSENTKYDLLQIKPKNFTELIVTMALRSSYDNHFIYTYLKNQQIQPDYFSTFEKHDKIVEILKETNGLIIWREQEDEIIDYLYNLTEVEGNHNGSDVFGLSHLLDFTSMVNTTLLLRKAHSDLALLCYKLAYFKAHFRNEFNQSIEQE